MSIIGFLFGHNKVNPESEQLLNDYAVYKRHVEQGCVNWGDNLVESITSCYEYDPSLVQDLHSLKICFKCFELYGQVQLEKWGQKEQKCLCTTNKTDELWWGYKFNRKYEICDCCGLEVIPSGSVWSLLYCRDCTHRISELNNKVGRCVIPLGKHSLINGIALTGNMPISAISEFVNAVNTMNQKIELVEQHGKNILARRARLLNLSKDAPIIDLVLKTSNLELKQMKDEAFFELLALCTNMSLDKVKSLYQELMD